MDTPHQLLQALAPRSIALLGASDREGSRASALWKSLISSGFQGELYPVNPKYRFLGDVACYNKIGDIDSEIDLAILATPAAIAEKLLEEVAARGVRFVMLAPGDTAITSAPAWQAHIVNKARSLKLRLIGTDCLGIIRPSIALNASYWQGLPMAGNVGFACQSGVIGTTVLASAQLNHIGFSSLINTGDEIDVSMDEVIDFFAQDNQTRVIVVHAEGIRNPREFFSSVREASKRKPVIILRGGKSIQAGQLLAKRMSVPAGDDRVFNALIERAGAIRVYGLEDMLAAIEMFSQRRLPRANRLGIISNGSGFGVLAADAAADAGVKLANLSRATTQRLHDIFNNPLPVNNPIDLWADADPRRIKLSVDALNRDENVDAILIVTAPTFAAPLERVADAISYATDSSYKPILTAWIGETQTAAAKQRLKDHPISVMKSPESAVRAFSLMCRYAENRRFIQSSIPTGLPTISANIEAARRIIEEALAQNCYSLDEQRTKRVLASIGLTTASGILVTSATEAVDAAKTLGFPVVMKVIADGVEHKSNVGGVRLDVRTEKDAYELANAMVEEVKVRAPYAHIRGIYVQRLVRSSSGRETRIHIHNDSRFGPVIGFGAGGHMGEVYHDEALQLLPLTEPLARELLEKPQVSQFLNEFRGMPAVDKETLVTVLLRLSRLVRDIPAIRNLTIDPLLVDAGGAIVLDAHIGLSDAALHPDNTASHLTLAPEPEFGNAIHTIKNGAVTLRSMRAQDYDATRAMLKRLSPQSAYLRFHVSTTDLAREKVVELTNLDYNREIAIVAIDQEQPDEIRGVARFKRINGSRKAEFGILVEDAWQNRGLATLLMTTLIEKARQNHIDSLVGYVIKGNEAMYALMKRLGFVYQESDQDGDAFVEFTLNIR